MNRYRYGVSMTSALWKLCLSSNCAEPVWYKYVHCAESVYLVYWLHCKHYQYMHQPSDTDPSTAATTLQSALPACSVYYNEGLPVQLHVCPGLRCTSLTRYNERASVRAVVKQCLIKAWHYIRTTGAQLD